MCIVQVHMSSVLGWSDLWRGDNDNDDDDDQALHNDSAAHMTPLSNYICKKRDFTHHDPTERKVISFVMMKRIHYSAQKDAPPYSISYFVNAFSMSDIVQNVNEPRVNQTNKAIEYRFLFVLYQFIPLSHPPISNSRRDINSLTSKGWIFYIFHITLLPI